MKFKIHRGTKEIGGSCVEVWTENTRIIIDIGMPIVGLNGGEFNFRDYENLSVTALQKEGVLPPVEGLYPNSKPSVDAVLISHPHIDHFGLGQFVHDDVRFYMGKLTHKLIELSGIFTPLKTDVKNVSYFEKEKSFNVGDITITAYWMDHSAFDAYSFFIEADGKSIFYSGDFRGHGRKKNVFKRFLHIAPKNVDCLLIEGTQLTRENAKSKTESELENDFVDLFKGSAGINLVSASGQNIDRLVTIYRACKRVDKTMVIDVYTATVLKELAEAYPSLPQPSPNFPEIKVMFPYYTCRRLDSLGLNNLMYQFKRYKFTKEQIAENKENIVMLVRSSMKKDLDKIDGIDGGNIIHSLWEGYLSRGSTKTFVDSMVKERGFNLHIIHTSGHADLGDLKAMVDAIEPKSVVPIHTFRANEYEKHYDCDIKQLKDGEVHCLL